MADIDEAELLSIHGWDGPDERIESDACFAEEYLLPERCIKVSARTDNSTQLEFFIPQNLDKVCNTLWSSSIVLAELVAKELPELCASGCDVLELGCGSALVSMVAACLGAKAVATDQDLTSVQDAMARNANVLSMAKGSMASETLDWGHDMPPKTWGAVLCADLLYAEKGLVPLAATLGALARGSPQAPRILMAYQLRNPAIERKFFGAMLESERLSYREVPLVGLQCLDKYLEEFIKVVEIFPK